MVKFIVCSNCRHKMSVKKNGVVGLVAASHEFYSGDLYGCSCGTEVFVVDGATNYFEGNIEEADFIIRS